MYFIKVNLFYRVMYGFINKYSGVDYYRIIRWFYLMFERI